jgi:hypothetical protein
VTLKKGRNVLLAKMTGRGWAVLGDNRPDMAELKRKASAQHLMGCQGYMTGGPHAAYDILSAGERAVGWYRFDAPPGLESVEIVLRGKPLGAWADGEPLAVEKGEPRGDGACRYTLKAARTVVGSSTIVLRLEHERGYYGGAAIVEPAVFRCGKGRAPLALWHTMGLKTYSGAAWYRTSVDLGEEHARCRTTLDLGTAKGSVNVRVNGKDAGMRVGPSYRIDISSFVKPGPNLIEIRLANTVANHFHFLRSGWKSYESEEDRHSGLEGPVRIGFRSRVVLK